MSATTAEHAEHHRWHAHHFVTMKQQADAAKMGMWFFLAQELLFFSGLFMAYIALRYYYPGTFLYAARAPGLGAWARINTLFLLTSSLTMALAVRGAQTDNKPLWPRWNPPVLYHRVCLPASWW